MIENYKHKYQSRGKWFFVPNERCVRKGNRILAFFSKRVDFPDYFYHYKPGGHIAALQSHIENKLFFKIDIQNFYYSIARMRVTRALRSWGYPGANTLAKWSCVVNPMAGPPFALPIGFVQSPLLASLVLMRSPIAQAIERAIANGVKVSVYLDDIIGSNNDASVLEAAYTDIRDACVTSGLIPNPTKLVAPTGAVSAFNCDLTHGSAVVRADRIARFLSEGRGPGSHVAFEQYRLKVANANKPKTSVGGSNELTDLLGDQTDNIHWATLNAS